MLIDSKILSLIKIVETGSFTKTADALGLTQPAISQHIKQLEEELGIKIFYRGNNEFRLTPDGEIVLEYARRLVAIDNALRQNLADEKAKVTSIAVGITHTVESSVIVEALAGYAKEQGGIAVKVVTDSIQNLYQKLKNYEVDFIIVSDRIKDTTLRYSTLVNDSLELIVSPEHPLAGKKAVNFSDIKGERFILRTVASDTRHRISKSMKKSNHSLEEFDIVLELDNIATIKDLIRRNFGVSILAKSSCMDEILKKKLISIPIQNLDLQREIVIASNTDYEHSEIIDGIVTYYNAMK